MHFKSILGKWAQLRGAPTALWLPFIREWLLRKKNGFVPCAIPDCDHLLRVPLTEFYESYGFFCEHPRGGHELDYFLRRLKPNDVFYDIGGFRGAYSAAAKIKLRKEISIHVFEPLAKNVEAIQQVRELNSFDNFKINPLAVGDGSLIVGSVNEQDAMLRLGDKNAGSAVKFPSTSLDDYIARGNSAPTIVKIDVDGFELHTLRGARQCLSKNHPRLWMEIHPQFLADQGTSAEAVLNFLQDFNYTISFFGDYIPKSDMPYHIWGE